MCEDKIWNQNIAIAAHAQLSVLTLSRTTDATTNDPASKLDHHGTDKILYCAVRYRNRNKSNIPVLRAKVSTYTISTSRGYGRDCEVGATNTSQVKFSGSSNSPTIPCQRDWQPMRFLHRTSSRQHYQYYRIHRSKQRCCVQTKRTSRVCAHLSLCPP